jgi:glutamine amidotransferase
MIVVVDYGAGNIGSILNMFKRLGADIIASSDPSIIENATKLVLPGVGSFDLGMTKLIDSGVVEVLNKKVLIDKIPILGICLGVQLMTEGSEEGELAGLGWFKARTIKFRFTDQQADLKIPHMGWNDTFYKKDSKIFNKDDEEYRYYYVHSYHISADNELDILSTASYGYEFVSGLERDNIIGLQFHPEKSHSFGMKIFKNFIDKF